MGTATEKDISIRLEKNEGFTITGDSRGIIIRCQEGILWITQAGDPEDHFLSPRQEFLVNRSGTVVVEARRDACLAILDENETVKPLVTSL